MGSLVIPFAVPQYNWNDLQAAYKQFGKSSPTRSVDQTGLSLTQPSAFMAVFKDRDTGWCSSHVPLSFLFLVPTMMTIDFEELLHPVTFHRLIAGDMGGDLLIGTGILFHWQAALKLLDNHPYEMYNRIYEQLKAYIRKYEV